MGVRRVAVAVAAFLACVAGAQDIQIQDAGAAGTVSTSGTLTANTLPKATSATALANSTITDTGSLVTVITGSTFRASPPQNGATGMVDFIGTLTPNASGSPTLVRMVGTGAGSSTGTVQNFVNYILGGYTGSSPTIALYQGNENAGTNTTLGGGNSGTVNDFFTATTGHIYGTQNKVFGSTTLNVGTHNFLGNCNSAGACIGILNLVANAGAGTKNAGVFALQTTLPTLASAAVLADNSAQAVPIALFRDNGTTTMAIQDAGSVWAAEGTKTLTESAATTFVRVAVASGAATGGKVFYCAFAADASDLEERCGDVNFAVVNKAGTETCVVGTPADALASSSGTFTVAFTADTATPTNGCDIQANAVSSLTQTTLNFTYHVQLSGAAASAVTPQ